MSDPALNERVRALEVEFSHANEKLDEMKTTLDELHDVFMQAKGVKWVLVGGAAFMGFFAGILGWVLPWWFSTRS